MPFDDELALIVFLLTAIILSIVALAKSAGLKTSIDELRRRVGDLEGGRASIPAPVATKTSLPPPLPAYVAKPATCKSSPAQSPAVPQRTRPIPFNWESILGVKLFAWIGGLALFLGVVFFVKYAFENNWITPAMRIVAGALIGVALVIVSLLPAVRRYRVPAQSVCGTAILILYADIYAAHSFYNLIPLTLATALMWIVTGGVFVLANYLKTESAVWLGLTAGFLTPILFRQNYSNPVVLFSYVGVLDCAVATVSALKRWNHLILLAAMGSIATEFVWAARFFGDVDTNTTRIAFLVLQALFLAMSIAFTRAKRSDHWSLSAAAFTGFAVLAWFIGHPENNLLTWDFGFLTLLLSGAGLIVLAAGERAPARRNGAGAIVGVAFALTWLAEWTWEVRVFSFRGLDDASLVVLPHVGFLIWCYVAIFLLFAVTPYVCGTKQAWPWMIAAIAGPLQFRFVHQYLVIKIGIPPGHLLIPHGWLWIPTIAFAIPAVIGIWYLVKKEGVALASGDSRLAAQGAAVLAFVSLIFPVQFQREWITLSWAIEGLALILLFRWIPNRRLRAVSLIVLAAAFVRLALNPAVLNYHPRTHTPIWNWYLYAYGISAICFFLGARWFSEPREKKYEQAARPLLYSLAGIVVFLLMNIEIADYFSIGPTLTFSFEGNFARDMTYTIAWSLFAFCLLVVGIARKVRGARLVAIALLCLAFAKLFLHDLDSLRELYRIAAFIVVAVIAIVASFVYQRFLSPATKQT